MAAGVLIGLPPAFLARRRRNYLSWLARMVRALQVRLDLIEREPRGLELHLRVEFRLVEIVFRLRIGALPELQQRQCARLRAEFDYAHIRVARHAVAPLLPFSRGGIEIEDYAGGAGAARNRQAGVFIAERFELAPGESFDRRCEYGRVLHYKEIIVSEQCRKTNASHLAIKLSIQVAFISAVLLLIYFGKQSSPNRDDEKLKELRQLAAEIFVFPGFRETATYESSRATDAGVYKHYSSLASYQEVVQFYSTMLSQRGWAISGERTLRTWFGISSNNKTLTFEKGDNIISIQCICANSTDKASQYSISFVWYSKDSPAR
jgi:hypothetical protein